MAVCCVKTSMSQHKMDSEARALYDDWLHEGTPSPMKGTGAASVILVGPDLQERAVPSGLHQLSKLLQSRTRVQRCVPVSCVPFELYLICENVF